MTPPLLILLDGNALLHRAWHALPPLTTKDGRVVNAAYGFAMVLEKLLARYSPSHIAVAWDLPGGTFRNEAFEAYKAQRKEKEPELYMQIPIIQEMLTLYGITSVSKKGFEADDVIGTLAELPSERVLIVTGDLDALQLVNDRVHVLFFQKGISETVEYDPKTVEERYGFGPECLIDFKALRGDTSDNIPGVPGIGEKSGTELVLKYGTVEAMLDAVKKGTMDEKYAKKFRGEEETAMLAKHLVTVVRDVPLDLELSDITRKEEDEKKLLALFRDLDFKTLLKKRTEVRSSPALGGMDIPPPPIEPREEKGKGSKSGGAGSGSAGKSSGSLEIVKNIEDFLSFSKDLASPTGVLLVEQAPDLFGTSAAALAVSDGKQTVVFARPAGADLKKALATLKGQTVTHDVKKFLTAIGEEECEDMEDVMLASYLLHSASRAHDLPAIVSAELEKDLPELPVTGATDAELQAIGEATRFLPELWKSLERSLDEGKLMNVYRDIERPLVPALRAMESCGITVDVEALHTFSKKLRKRLEELEAEIQKLAGETFNVNSPSQLAHILFETLALPTKGIKKTKSGFSTAAPELEKLYDAHAIIPLVGEYRELAKLQSTYAESLPRLVAADGRIHTTYNQTIAATGRLSSINPNLQNIPIKTDLGNEIRKAFTAAPGMTLVALDYSQIELRLIACIAEDKAFIEAFRDGADIHTRTASEVWETPEKDVTSEQRRHAKAINFGIMYGMGPHALARSTGMKYQEAQDFIVRYFSIHDAVRRYLDNTKKLAHSQGYVETMFGRKRFFPEIDSGVPMLVAAAERMAINMPVQGTAADLMKMAMIAAHNWLQKNGGGSILLQVHDELILECPEKEAKKTGEAIRLIMRDIAKLAVPLEVNMEIGTRWGEMKEVE